MFIKVFLSLELDNRRVKGITVGSNSHPIMTVERFRYGRQQFLINMVLLLALVIMVPLVLVSLGGVDIIILSGMMLLVIMLIAFFAISPMVTCHEIDDSSVILRQGWYFKAIIPLENIKGVRRIDQGPRRTGTWSRTLGDELYVTTRRYDIIEVKLKETQRFPWAMWKSGNRVFFDTLDNSEIIRSLERRGITPSNPVLRS
jgi:hypothetical protein